MERTTLGPVEKFRDDSGARHIGQRVMDIRCNMIYHQHWPALIVFRLYDTGEIVLVDPSRLAPNEPSKPIHEMSNEELAS